MLDLAMVGATMATSPDYGCPTRGAALGKGGCRADHPPRPTQGDLREPAPGDEERTSRGQGTGPTEPSSASPRRAKLAEELLVSKDTAEKTAERAVGSAGNAATLGRARRPLPVAGDGRRSRSVDIRH